MQVYYSSPWTTGTVYCTCTLYSTVRGLTLKRLVLWPLPTEYSTLRLHTVTVHYKGTVLYGAYSTVQTTAYYSSCYLTFMNLEIYISRSNQSTYY